MCDRHALINSRPVAQLVEWRSPKPQVGGSKPSWPANTCKVNMNSSTKELNRNILGRMAWVAIIFVTVMAFIGNYHFDFSVPVRAIIWLVWFIVSILLFYLTEQGRQAYLFAKESKIEMQKVVWPSRAETMQTTMIVMVMVAVTGFVLWAVDMSMMWVIGKITHLG